MRVLRFNLTKLWESAKYFVHNMKFVLSRQIDTNKACVYISIECVLTKHAFIILIKVCEGHLHAVQVSRCTGRSLSHCCSKLESMAVCAAPSSIHPIFTVLKQVNTHPLRTNAMQLVDVPVLHVYEARLLKVWMLPEKEEGQHHLLLTKFPATRIYAKPNLKLTPNHYYNFNHIGYTQSLVENKVKLTQPIITTSKVVIILRAGVRGTLFKECHNILE